MYAYTLTSMVSYCDLLENLSSYSNANSWLHLCKHKSYFLNAPAIYVFLMSYTVWFDIHVPVVTLLHLKTTLEIRPPPILRPLENVINQCIWFHFGSDHRKSYLRVSIVQIYNKTRQ